MEQKPTFSMINGSSRGVELIVDAARPCPYNKGVPRNHETMIDSISEVGSDKGAGKVPCHLSLEPREFLSVSPRGQLLTSLMESIDTTE